MYSNFLATEEDTGIANPTIEGGDQVPQTIYRDNTDYPKDTDVNINIDTTHGQKGDINVVYKNRDEDRIAEMHYYINQYLPSRWLTIDPNDYFFAGQESIGGFIKNTFSSIINTLGHILNLFKTALFDGWRDFKRSELKEYCDSNVMTIMRIRHIDQGVLDGFMLDVPNGMKGSYKDAFTSLTDCLKEMDMTTRSKTLLKSAERVLDSIRDGNSAFASAVNAANKDYSDQRNIERLFGETEHYFTTNTSITKVPFEKCYVSVPELSEVLDMVLDAESDMQAVASVHDRLQDLEDTINTISDHPNVGDMSRPAIDNLAKIVRAWAFLFEKYSIIMNDVYRVNHNVMLNLQDIRKTAGM